LSYAHPGSIQARVGAALAGIELNTEQQDIPGIKNFTDLLEDYASVYMEPDNTGKTALDKLPRFDWAATEDENMERLRARRRHCLRVLREQNIFGYVGTPPIGDASIMKQTLGGTEEELEA
jgi:hypothetical protein